MGRSVLFATVNCPYCHQEITDRVSFRWGGSHQAYSLGDQVFWYTSNEGVPIGSRVIVDDSKLSSNFGDPSVKNLIAFEEVVHAPDHGELCYGCRSVIGAVGITILNSKLNNVHVYSPEEIEFYLGEYAEFCSVLELTANAQVVPRIDFYQKRKT